MIDIKDIDQEIEHLELLVKGVRARGDEIAAVLRSHIEAHKSEIDAAGTRLAKALAATGQVVEADKAGKLPPATLLTATATAVKEDAKDLGALWQAVGWKLAVVVAVAFCVVVALVRRLI